MTIRDFIYLDIERVRSFYAQLSEGLPTERTTAKSKQHGIDGKLEGDVLLARGSTSTDYRYARSATETTSLHDYIMEEFLEKLRKEKRLMTLPQDRFEWEEDNFRDGMFISVTGVVKIVDYKFVASSIENLPKLAKAVNRITNKSTAAHSPNGMQEMEKQLKALPTKDVAQFIEQNMQDSLRVRIFPYRDNTDRNFLASADSSFFRYSSISLIGMYGYVIDAGWTALLQINRGSAHETSKFTSGNTGVNIESVLETMADNMAGISGAFQGVKFPEVAATPVAIFREI